MNEEFYTTYGRLLAHLDAAEKADKTVGLSDFAHWEKVANEVNDAFKSVVPSEVWPGSCCGLIHEAGRAIWRQHRGSKTELAALCAAAICGAKGEK